MPGQSAVTQRDIIYFYDASFEGFLNCVFESYEDHEMPFDIWRYESRQQSMFPLIQILTDQERAARVYRSICTKLGPEVKHLIMLGFLNGEEGKELKLLRFLRLAFEKGPTTAKMLGHPDVAAVVDLQKAVAGEAHLLKGFIRFEERGGILGSVISPKNMVLPLLRGHFCARYPNEDFLLYDNNHYVALSKKGGKVEYTQFERGYLISTPEEREAGYQHMWKAFYQAVNIKQRENLELRRSNCPKRYWENMLELRDEL